MEVPKEKNIEMQQNIVSNEIEDMLSPLQFELRDNETKIELHASLVENKQYVERLVEDYPT